MALRIETVTIDARRPGGAGPLLVGGARLGAAGGRGRRRVGGTGEPPPRPRLEPSAALPRPSPNRSRSRTGSTSTCAPTIRTLEVERLEALGATRVSVGQTGLEDWVVLADPEGNEFCVLSDT